MARKNLFIAGQAWNGVEQLEIPLNDNGKASTSKKAKFIETSSDKPASAAEILTGKEAYVNGAVVQGQMANNGQLNVTLDPGASKNVSNGYYSGGTVSAKAITTEAKTEQVTTNDQLRNGVVIEPTSGKYLSKATVTFANDIFDVGDATVTENDIIKDAIAYGKQTSSLFGQVKGKLAKINESSSDEPQLYSYKLTNGMYRIGFGVEGDNYGAKRYITVNQSQDTVSEANTNIVWMTNYDVDARDIKKNVNVAGVIGTGWQIQWKNNDKNSGILLIN